MIRFEAAHFTVETAQPGDAPTRSITGLAVPWNVTTTDSQGTRVMFMPGSLSTDGRAPKLVESHDLTQIRGLVTDRRITDVGMEFTARLADTAAANDTMALLTMGALDAVSVGVVPTKFKFDQAGTMVVEAADWQELSLVAIPAFDSARIASVTAQAPDENPTEPETETESEQETPEMTEPIEAAAPAVIPTPALPAQPRREFKMPSAAEYIVKFAAGGAEFAEFNAKIKAAAPDITTDDTPGILPEPIVGTVYSQLDPVRPFVSAIGTRAMPASGATFRRPVITVYPTAAEQSNQLASVNATTMTISNNNVDKITFGNYVTLSEQDIDFSDPNSVAIVVNQLGIAYGQATNEYAIDECYNSITQSQGWDPTVAQDMISGVYTAAATIASGTNRLPTHLIVSPTVWGYLGSLVDDSNRPLFATVNPMNAPGSMQAGSFNGNPLGLNIVVDKECPGSFIGHLAGASAGFEFYEQQRGAISIEVPSILGRTIAWRGQVAAFTPAPDLLVKLTD